MSGLLYQWGGLMVSLIGSAVMLTACWLITLALPDRVTAKTGQGPAALPDGGAEAAPLAPMAEQRDLLRSERA